MIDGSSLAPAFNVTEWESEYDASAKKIISNTAILSYILRDTVDGFQGMPISEIQKCIVGIPTIAEAPVTPGYNIRGENLESNIVGEGVVYYDIRFSAITPDNIPVTVLIDIEIQKKYKPSYDLVTRGIFYCARMLSEQLNHGFKIPEYDKLSKVYSIWICPNTPKYAENTITKYSVQPENIIGNIKKLGYYDLLSVYILGLPNSKGAGDGLLRLLRMVLGNDVSNHEKVYVLEKEYDVAFSRDEKEVLDSMCNLGKGIYEEGREEGRVEGREEGKLEQAASTAQALFQDGFSVESIKRALLRNLDEVTVDSILRSVLRNEDGSVNKMSLLE